MASLERQLSVKSSADGIREEEEAPKDDMDERARESARQVWGGGDRLHLGHVSHGEENNDLLIYILYLMTDTCEVSAIGPFWGKAREDRSSVEDGLKNG
jgi:hypothetical protein